MLRTHAMIVWLLFFAFILNKPLLPDTRWQWWSTLAYSSRKATTSQQTRRKYYILVTSNKWTAALLLRRTVRQISTRSSGAVNMRIPTTASSPVQRSRMMIMSGHVQMSLTTRANEIEYYGAAFKKFSLAAAPFMLRVIHACIDLFS